MNRILPTVVAFFSSQINTLKEIIVPFLQIDTRVLRLNGNGQNSKGSLKIFIISMVLLFTVSFANATDYYSKSTGNLNTLTSWGINTDGRGTSPSILPPSACPAYTASIKTNGSVCNSAPPPSVNLKVTLGGGQSPYSVQFRNEITGVITTVPNYTSDTDIGIPVPAVTTPYTLVSVIDANGCLATITQAYTSILLYSIPATPTANIVNVACSSDATGSITMNNAYQPGSLKFNGVNTNSGSTSPIDSHVDFGTPLLSNLTQFTGEGWIKFDKTKYQARMSLFGQNDVVEFGFESNNLRCWTANGGNVNYPLSSYPSDNAWHHIAVVANGTNLQFYIDGVSVVTGGSPPASNYGSSAYTTKIGWGVMDVGGVGLVGEVFNLSFWSRALSSDEIKGLATGFTQYNSKQVGLLAGYSFNEGSGTTMSSVGSVAPTGTLKGATLPVWTDPSTYSWTSTPPGFTSSLKNLTGLSPKTYNLAINLKGCPKTTSFVVNAANVSPTISTAATPAVVTAVCSNSSAQTTTMAYTATTGTPTSYSIAWTTSGITNQSSTTFAFASGGGTVTGIIVPANISAGTYAGTMTIKTANGCTATQSISLVVGSVTPATPTATPATNVGCSNFTANWNPVAGATGYYLDVSPDSNFGNYNIGGFQNQAVTGTSFGITGLTAGQTCYYRVRAYNSCGNKTSVSSSNIVNISVSVAVTNSILTQTICSGDSSAAVVLTSGVVGTTFDWTASAPSGIAGFTASATGTSGLPVQTITNSGTAPGTVTYSITPKANGCTGTAVNYTIVVNPTPKVSNTPLTQTICSGSSFTLVTLTSATAGASFTWTATATAGVTGFSTSGTNTIPALNISTSGTTQGTITYVVTPTANGCPGTASNYTILVNPTPIVTNTPLTQTICSGGNTALVTLTSGVTGTTFAWTASATAGVAGFTTSGTGTIPVQAISTTGTTQGTVTYVITPTASGCPGTATNYTVLVNPLPTVTNTPLTQTICSGGNTALVTLSSGVASTTFAWTATATAGVTGFATSGTSTIAVQAISTTGTTQGTVTYVITPTASGCPGTATNYTVLVNPLPTVTNTPLTQTVCSGGNTTLVTLTSGVASTTFAWTATATAGVTGFATSGTGTIPVQTISTTGTTQGTVTYVITPTASGCPGAATNYTVLVNPRPTVTNTPLTQTICSGGSSALVTLTSGVATTTFAWTATATAGVSGFATSGTGTIPVQTISTTGTTQGTVTYVITPTANGCPGTATNYTVLVNPNNTIVLSSAVGTDSQAVCVNTPIANITYATTGAIGATFANLPTGVSGSWAANVVTISGTPTVAGAALTYTVTLTGGCGSISATGTRTITVNALPSIPTASATTQPTCAVPTGTITVTAPITGNMYTVTGVSPLVYTATNGTGVFPGLAVGSYNVTTSNATCTSTATGPISINAQATKNWIGGAVAGISNWNVPGNWSPSGVPSATDCVTIPNVINKPIISGTNGNFYSNMLTVSTDSSLTVNGTNVLTVSEAVIVQGTGTLTFENTASLVQINDVDGNSGSITYKRISAAMNNFDFTYWSSPVAGQTLFALSPNTLADKYYSFENNAWKTELNGAATMDFGKGYIIRTPKDNGGAAWPNGDMVSFPYAQPVKFIGAPNNGANTLAIGTTNGDANLIGNPYPSAMSADKFLLANKEELDGTIYFWTHNTPIYNLAYSASDYASYNGVGGTNTSGNFIDSNNNGIKDPGEEQIANRLDGNIAAGQSFFTVTKRGVSPTGKVTFNNSMRVGVANKNAQFFKGSNSKATTVDKHRVWLNLTNTEGAFKQTLVGYVTGATQGNDSAFDGESFDGNRYIDFYSINENKNLVIQGRALPFDKTDKVTLGYKTTVEGAFAISIDQVDGALENQTVFVEDKVANVIHNLKTGAYSFSTGKGVFNDRFVLRYMDNTPVVPEPEIKDPIVTDPGVKDPVVTNPIVPNPEVKDPIVLDPNNGSGTLGTEGFENKGRAVVVSVKDHQIKINSFDETIASVKVYDLRGRLLFKNEHVNRNEYVIQDLNSSDQYLIVLTQLVNGKWVTKEIVF